MLRMGKLLRDKHLPVRVRRMLVLTHYAHCLSMALRCLSPPKYMLEVGECAA